MRTESYAQIQKLTEIKDNSAQRSNPQPGCLHCGTHFVIDVDVEQEMFGNFERSDQGVWHPLFKCSRFRPAVNLDFQGISLVEGGWCSSLKYFMLQGASSHRPVIGL